MNHVKLATEILWEGFVDVMNMESDVVRQPCGRGKELVGDVEAINVCQ